MTKHWLAFWDNYRNVEARSEHDLFLQVGKTISQQPIPRDMFASMLTSIVEHLELKHGDHLLDLCCGNGLVSFELAQIAGRVTAVDFARHLIEAAQRLKSLPNIEYRVGDVTAPLSSLVRDEAIEAMPSKFLMNDALAYFDPQALGTILDNVTDALGSRPFRFLLTGIPSHALKWNFYDTPERRARHAENNRRPENTNDGMGRWWHRGEIKQACDQRGFHVLMANQKEAISNYRMDAMIWRS